MRWLIVCVAILALLGTGCQRRTTGATVSDYQKKRAELLKRQQRRNATVQPHAEAEAGGEESSFSAVTRSFSYDGRS